MLAPLPIAHPATPGRRPQRLGVIKSASVPISPPSVGFWHGPVTSTASKGWQVWGRGWGRGVRAPAWSRGVHLVPVWGEEVMQPGCELKGMGRAAARPQPHSFPSRWGCPPLVLHSLKLLVSSSRLNAPPAPSSSTRLHLPGTKGAFSLGFPPSQLWDRSPLRAGLYLSPFTQNWGQHQAGRAGCSHGGGGIWSIPSTRSQISPLPATAAAGSTSSILRPATTSPRLEAGE